MNHTKLISLEDLSVNYVTPTADKGYFESRYVRRSGTHIIVYLSSHSGCNQACRMCHLTQTKQTMMTPATLEDYVKQAKLVLDDIDFGYLRITGIDKVKFSFMARGEPLLNPTVVNDWQKLRRALKELVNPYFDVEFCISTIYPKEFKRSLTDVFPNRDTVIYYSIYSLDKTFRKKWLGNAIDPEDALVYLNYYAFKDLGRVKFHSAFIKGENDSIESVIALKNKIAYHFSKDIHFNIVRYNPYSPVQGEESSNLSQIREILKAKVISRVGKDVKASCGMFVQGI